MAGELSMLAGVVAEALPSPVAPSVSRSGTQRSQERGAPNKSTPSEGITSVPEGVLEERTLLTTILERARDVALANTTSLSFERDDSDGKMYLYIKDKDTGEELYRIPRKYLADIDTQSQQRHQVDVHI